MPKLETLAETAPQSTGSSPSAVLARTRLTVVHPPALLRVIDLGPEQLVLGRQSDPHYGVQLDSPTVSRNHFAVTWDPKRGAHLGQDLGSRNGSRVNGEPLATEPTELSDGAVIRLGDVLLVYERTAELVAEDVSGNYAAVLPHAVPGRALCVEALRAEIALAAQDPSPVLLIGETGTGKEYIANEIHRLSLRPGPLVAINCAALSSELIESQLFGHARGAFTGAQTSHEGLFRAANGGSLLLDEIGEFPLGLQPKLLRALQERQVLPVGETRAVAVDVRVIAATLQDLSEQAERGDFRLDLYARLSLWEIRVPALRYRRADLFTWFELLSRAWYQKRGTKRTAAIEIKADAAERLLLRDWPDNLRGLDRLVHRICSRQVSGRIDLPSLEALLAKTTGTDPGSPVQLRLPEPHKPATNQPGDGVSAPQTPTSETSAAAEAGSTPTRNLRVQPKPTKPTKKELTRILKQKGSVRAAAVHFQRHRRQIYRWMDEYGLRDRD